jgi:hypothetical protein
MRTSTPPSLRSLAAFSLAACLALPTATRAEETSGFHWKVDEQAGTADLLRGDQPVLRYMYAYDTSSPERTEETFKVYHHVFAPDSQTIITKGPGGLYTHHRGLYVGWNKTEFDGKSLDFWHGRQGVHQRHERFVEKEGDEESGHMTSEIHWNDAEGEAVIVETRTLVVTPEPKTQGWQIDWSSTLESRRGEIKLDGDRQHAGFQYRAAQDVAEAQGARFLRPADFSQDTKAIEVGDQGDPPAHINLGWFAMTYELDGQRYTVEYFDNPDLPKPSLFSERPYGRFGTFFKTTLREGEPLEMKYRVVVSAGEAPSVEAIQQRYEEFVASLKD